MDFNESIALKLIMEMKKPGRECMYDMKHRSYKNNHVKQNIWTAISNSIGIKRSECQALWKTLRRRHKSTLRKNIGRSGSKFVEVKGFSKILIGEMEYFQNFWEVKEHTVTKHTDLNNESFRNHFEETSRDPILDDSENEYKEYRKSLNNLAEKVLQASTEKRNPFFLALEEEFSKVPDNKKSALKVKLLSLIVEQQQ